MSWLGRLLRRPSADPPHDAPVPAAPNVGKAPRGPEALTTLSFDRFLEAHPRAVVDVWAPWCGPCRAFAPVFLAFAKEWGGEIGFGKIHADHEPSLVRRFHVRSIPSTLYFRGGELVRSDVGVLPPDRFDRRLRSVFRDLPRR